MSVSFPRLTVLSHSQVVHARHLCRPLVGVKGSAYPHVAVVQHLEGGEFVVAERSGDRAADEATIASATKNVRQQQWSWSVIEQAGLLFWKRPILLRGMGEVPPGAALPTEGGGVDDLPTELLLIPEAMEEAARVLRTRTLFAVVPKRGWLVVAPGEIGNPFAAQEMHQLTSGVASRAGRSAINGSVVLLWQEGRLVGVDGREGDSGYISMQGEDEANWWP